MRLRMLVTVAALTMLMTIVAVAELAAGPEQSAGVYEITMTAKKYAFDPAVFTVKRGEKVRLIITALDHDHGFKLDAYGINQVLKKGDPATVEFTADKPGTFEFKCSVFCGMGHGRMKGKLIVQEQ